MLQVNLRRAHRASALLLVAFACAHIANHLWALRGAAAHIELMDSLRLVYRHPLVEPLLLAAAGIQCASGWALVLLGWRRRTGWLAWLQAASGTCLATFLLVHVASVLYGRSVLGLDTNFYFAAAGLHAGSGAWFFGPYYFLAVLALFTHLGCALAWQVKGPPAQARRHVIGGAVLMGSIASASIVAALAGLIGPVDIPAAYKARYGAGDKIGPQVWLRADANRSRRWLRQQAGALFRMPLPRAGQCSKSMALNRSSASSKVKTNGKFHLVGAVRIGPSAHRIRAGALSQRFEWGL